MSLKFISKVRPTISDNCSGYLSPISIRDLQWEIAWAWPSPSKQNVNRIQCNWIMMDETIQMVVGKKRRKTDADNCVSSTLQGHIFSNFASNVHYSHSFWKWELWNRLCWQHNESPIHGSGKQMTCLFTFACMTDLFIPDFSMEMCLAPHEYHSKWLNNFFTATLIIVQQVVYVLDQCSTLLSFMNHDHRFCCDKFTSLILESLTSILSSKNSRVSWFFASPRRFQNCCVHFTPVQVHGLYRNLWGHSRRELTQWIFVHRCLLLT